MTTRFCEIWICLLQVLLGLQPFATWEFIYGKYIPPFSIWVTDFSHELASCAIELLSLGTLENLNVVANPWILL